jgi:hypothetical protein
VGGKAPNPETLIALRAAREACRMATEVAAAGRLDVRTVACRGCGQRFPFDPAAGGSRSEVDPLRLLCLPCRRRIDPARHDPPAVDYGQTVATPLPARRRSLLDRLRTWLDDVDDRRRGR